MRFVFILGSMLLFFVHSAKAQSGKLFFEFNYNTFSHGSLKNFQEEFANDITEVDVRINDNFPANYGFTIGYKINSINTSIFGSYTNTGGKISYSDFSGTIRLTQPLTGYTLGGMYEFALLGGENTGELTLGMKGFATYSNFDIVSFNEINDSARTETISTSSIDLGAGVGVIYEYTISIIRLRASVGFDVVLGGKQFLKEDRDFFIEDNSGSPVRTGWTGARLGIGASIPL